MLRHSQGRGAAITPGIALGAAVGDAMGKLAGAALGDCGGVALESRAIRNRLPSEDPGARGANGKKTPISPDDRPG
jgi:hypothetical protein